MIKVGHELSDHEIEQKYDQIATQLDMPAYFYPAVADFAAPAASSRAAAPAAPLLVDIGCGNGNLLSEVVKRVPDARCVGLELSTARLRIAQGRLPENTLLAQIGGDNGLPFGDSSVDLVLVTEVIEHLREPERLLAEIRRVLRPDGRLILTTPNSDAYVLWRIAAPIARRFPRLPVIKQLLPYEHPLRTLQPIDTMLALPEVGMILQHAGFRKEEVHGREALPFIFSLPGIRRYKWERVRVLLDGAFNRAGWERYCYRSLWKCAMAMS